METFQAEYVVEQAIIESNLKETIANHQKEESQVSTTETVTVVSTASEQTKSEEIEEVENTKPEVCSFENKEDSGKPSNTEVLEEKAEDICSMRNEETQEIESSKEGETCQRKGSDGSVPSVEGGIRTDNGDSLYPNVVVMSEPSKDVEMIECKVSNSRMHIYRYFFCLIREMNMNIYSTKDFFKTIADSFVYIIWSF